jgi:hypothetical protein
MGLPLQIFHAERCVRKCAPEARYRAAFCALIASVQRNSVSSCAWPPAFARSSRGLACERCWRHRRRLWWRLARAAPVAPSSPRCARPRRWSPRSCRVWSRRIGRSRRTSQVCRHWASRPCEAKPAPAPCQARRRWGLSPCLLMSPCWLSSQPPSEPAASWKGSSMRVRMTPTPEAPGCWRQVVCSCEGPPVGVPMPLKATRPRSSAM